MQFKNFPRRPGQINGWEADVVAKRGFGAASATVQQQHIYFDARGVSESNAKNPS